MADYNPAGLIGNFSVKPSAAELAILKRMDMALFEGVRHSELLDKPASFFVWSLHIFTAVPASSSGSSVKVRNPWPINILAADVGCESAAGATGTLQLYDDGVAVLAAAKDIKTGAGTGQRVYPEDGKEDIAYNSEIYITGNSGAGGTIVGAQAHLYCQRA